MSDGTSTELSSVVTEVAYNTSTHIYDTYDVFVHPHWKQFPPIPAAWHYGIGTYITIVGITGVLGNSLVIYMFSSTKNLRTPSNWFIVNLALSDMAFSLINGFPLLSLSAFNKKWMFGQIACELYGLAGGIFGLMSINTLTAIAYDRYVAITKPLHAARIMTRRRAFIMIILVWIWSVIWSFPPIFGWGAYIPEGFQTSCTFDYLTTTLNVRSFIIGMYVCGFAAPLVIIITCYYLILQAVRGHGKEMAKMAKQLNAEDVKQNKDKQTAEIKIAKVAMTLITLFLLSWSPYAIVALIAQFGPVQWVTPYVSELNVMLAKASAMHNPLVYAMSHPRFRDALNKRFPWLLCCCKPKEKMSASSVTQRSRTHNVRRTVSGNSGIGDANFSDVSSVISNLDVSDAQPEIEMGRKIPHDKETSFSNAAAMRNPDGSYTNQPLVHSGELVKELIGALVNVANNKSGAQPAVYLPTAGGNQTGASAATSAGNDVFIVDGKPVNLSQLVAACGNVGSNPTAATTLPATSSINESKTATNEPAADNDSAKQLLASSERNVV